MASHKNSLPIVTNGLVLHLDAANPKSYSGTDTTWNDLSGNRNTGTIISASYSSANGGSIATNGIDGYINIAYNTKFQTNNFTFCVWCNPSVNLDSHIASFETSIRGRAGWGLRLINTGSTWGFAMANVIRLNGGNVDLNYWQYVCGTYNGSNITLYKNGYQMGVTGSSANMNSTSPITIAARNPSGFGAVSNYNGKISTFQFYNTTLSAEDILKNYNATKSRFGLT
jgi:hypothetical protein